jgi:uncharacterized DUF497 family protein
MVNIEWDERKDRANQKKHGVSFEEAKSVFYDELAVQFYDDEHSGDENRFIMLGMSTRLRILVVCHCEKQRGNIVRIISARKATPSEKKFYPR